MVAQLGTAFIATVSLTSRTACVFGSSCVLLREQTRLTTHILVNMTETMQSLAMSTSLPYGWDPLGSHPPNVCAFQLPKRVFTRIRSSLDFRATAALLKMWILTAPAPTVRSLDPTRRPQRVSAQAPQGTSPTQRYWIPFSWQRTSLYLRTNLTRT